MLAKLRLSPGNIVLNPWMEALGVKLFVEMIATGLASTSNNTTLYGRLSVPVMVVGLLPVLRPWLNSGPTSIHPAPVNRYNC